MSSVQPKPAVDPVRRQQLCDERHAAQRTLWQESSLNRVRHCGNSLSKRTGSGDAVQVKQSGDVIGFSGLQSCGSVHSCPMCSQKIQVTRAGEVQDAVDAWHARGGRVLFVTLTMRHFLGQRLGRLMDAGSYAWGRITSGRAWEADCAEFGSWLPRTVKKTGETKYDYRIPFIRLSETTRTFENGWHNHFHTLLFLSAENATDDKIRRLSESIYGRWENALVSRGLTAPTPKHGIDCKLVRRGDSKLLGDYFSKNEYVGRITADKVGLEMAYSSGKTGKVDPATGQIIRAGSRTPFQILADVVALGDAEDLELWHEWEQASKGRRQLTWSVGLRDLLNLNPEKSDEEIAEEELQGQVVLTIPVEDWSALRWHKHRIIALVRDGVADLGLLKRIIFDPDRAAAA